MRLIVDISDPKIYLTPELVDYVLELNNNYLGSTRISITSENFIKNDYKNLKSYWMDRSFVSFDNDTCEPLIKNDVINIVKCRLTLL